MRGRKEDIGKGMDEKGCNEWIWEIVNIHLQITKCGNYLPHDEEEISRYEIEIVALLPLAYLGLI